jgi:GDP-L-fucose synthase
MTISLDSRIYVAGHHGMVGGALWRELLKGGYRRLIGRTHAELDLTDGVAVRRFFDTEKPEYVFLAAARVGGIHANSTRPVDFLLENLLIQSHVIAEAHRVGVAKLLFLGSSCIYPKLAPQPIREESLLSGPLEPTNQWYAIAKIAGLKLCQAYRRQHASNFIGAMPTNLYGPRDNYDLEGAHVLPALIRKFHEAKAGRIPTVTCWGTGAPLREFLYADDLARACVFLMRHYEGEDWINVGSGQEISIRDLASLVQRTVGYDGGVVWDTNRPDGTPRKLLDCSRIRALGWRPEIDLETGIRLAYEDFLKSKWAGWSAGKSEGSRGENCGI